MNDRISEELLSAYFDGELSAKERIRVERWLTGSPEAKQKVADYRRLSRLFEGLSRTEVPQEFAAEVLQGAERRMLLPEASAAPRLRQIRLWRLVIPATAAAALVLTINLWSGNPQHGRAIAERDQRETPSRGTPPVYGAEGGRSAAELQRNSVLPVETLPTGDSASTVGDGAVSAPLDNENSEAGAQIADEESLSSEAEQLVAAVIDDALLSAQKAGTERQPLSVVTIYVDGIEGLALVQKTLEDYGIVAGPKTKREEVVESPVATSPGASASASAPGQQALCVVVVDADQLIAAFSQMLQERHSSIRIESGDPIMLADLGKDARQKVTAALEEVSESVAQFAKQSAREVAGADQPAGVSPESSRDDSARSSPPETARTADAKPAPGKTTARRSPAGLGSRSLKKWLRHGGAETEISASVRPPDDEPASPKVAADAGNSEAQEPSSRQLRVSIPPVYQNRSRGTDSNNRREVTSQQVARAKRPATSDGARAEEEITEKSEADDKSSSRAPEIVQMLVVVETKTPPAAAAVPEKPADE